MRTPHRKLATLAAAILMPAALSAQLTFNLDTTFAGTSPDGTAPYLVGTFNQTNATTVTLTLSTPGLNTTLSQFVTEWGFNFNDSKSVSALNLSYTDTAIASVSKSVNGINLDGNAGHGFDFAFNFNTSNAQNRFVAGESIDVTLTYNNAGDTALSIADFDFDNKANGAGDYRSAAHVQGIPTGAGSGHIAATAIPEPGTYALIFGAAALGFVLLRRRQEKAAAA